MLSSAGVKLAKPNRRAEAKAPGGAACIMPTSASLLAYVWVTAWRATAWADSAALNTGAQTTGTPCARPPTSVAKPNAPQNGALASTQLSSS
ncbi:hypothetical protein G6F57_023429 [Rhizopus arrhizus]|nr:hypothetical protein G6F65_021019 [Rhizopus arrhizus]KAG1424661.1 hypothetical protein G6F57_023429 [Rhizopus arrhizus]